ncbi:hypothetical protein [Terrisporobacter sp.]|nr:hypothetical protein [Terrisporobacter sp.]
MKNLIILLLVGVCYFRMTINLTLKNEAAYTKSTNSLVFVKTN